MLTPTQSYIDFDELIQEDPQTGFRINHHLYKDEALFQAEMERIYYRGWVYIGHDSEIPDAGDFQLRVIGQRPVILVRDQNEKIRVFENKCRHRGNSVCQEQRGNSKFFRCAYHGWVFANT
ncbi:MAG: Rieske (2Fe-2S) protein, partial [Gammaproteobacteria bacterium]